MTKSIQIKAFYFFCLGLGILISTSCSNKNPANCYIVQGTNLDAVEANVVSDLKNDLEKVIPLEITILSGTDPLPEHGIFYFIGTQKSNQAITKLVNQGKVSISSENPRPRGGIWTKTELENNQNIIVLAGSDIQGLQRSVYNYAQEILGVDPLEYWTGSAPKKIDASKLFNFENKIIPPPKVPILCYFENDVDELANYRGKLLEYDWESYTEMINSLVRLGYNAIEFFDMLGRPEFFLRPEYKALHPDYEVDLDYLDKMMDYAHEKGMKIQINFALGYQIHPFPLEKSDCWAKYKGDWIAAWKYYLEETPLSKTDIFALRPRNQVWDWEYKSSCDENKIEVFNEVYEVFSELIEDYNPNAQKVLVCYSDAMEMWNEGFRPPKDWIVAWADDGFGKFESLPETIDGYDFGTYMHAGFWSNHTVHDPYPKIVEDKMKMMFNDFNAHAYCLVNGQNFRPFLLNLEAYGAVCQNPDSFDGEQFYERWTTRYFGDLASPFAVEAMKKLHEAQFDRVGYVQNLWEIREAISYLSDSPIERPGKTPVPHSYEKVQADYESLERRLAYISDALSAAEKGQDSVTGGSAIFYHDYVLLPIKMYNDLLTFEHQLHKLCTLKKAYEETSDKQQIVSALNLSEKAKEDLKIVHSRRIEGDKNPKWKGWYDPKIRRPNNGFPTMDMMKAIQVNLTGILNTHETK